MELHNLGALIATTSIPDVRWMHGDDLCNCTFQRIGEFANPYLGQTLRVRFCCVWAELEKEYPDFIQHIPAYWDDNSESWRKEPTEWDGGSGMPRALWYRQQAFLQGKSLEDVRAELGDQEPPKAVNIEARRRRETIYAEFSHLWK
jgi:nitroreductase